MTGVPAAPVAPAVRGPCPQVAGGGQEVPGGPPQGPGGLQEEAGGCLQVPGGRRHEEGGGQEIRAGEPRQEVAAGRWAGGLLLPPWRASPGLWQGRV